MGILGDGSKLPAKLVDAMAVLAMEDKITNNQLGIRETRNEPTDGDQF